MALTDRRRFPRVELTAPIFARRRSRDPSLAQGTTVIGTLVNASRGGVAFGCDEPLETGDLVELAVRAADGSAPLDRYAHVVACDEDLAHRHLVRCAFVEPTDTLDWVGELDVEPAPGPARTPAG
jgi:hypothetical protein